MMVSDADRRERLMDLIRLRRSVGVAAAAVKSLPWDSDEELVVLVRHDAMDVLRHYLSGKLSAVDLGSWAGAIEGREDIGLESGYEELLRRFVFESANPMLTEPVSGAFARAWLERLG